MIVRFSKGESVRFTSHLDVQRLFMRAFSRAKLKLEFSQGFNPHPKLSFASALALGMTSDAEWLDIKLRVRMDTEEFLLALNASLPEGMRALSAFEADDSMKPLSVLSREARYEAEFFDIEPALLNSAVQKLGDGEIIVSKRTKSGIRDVDLRPQLREISVNGSTLKIKGELTASGALSPELLIKKLLDTIDTEAQYRIKRTQTEFCESFIPAF